MKVLIIAHPGFAGVIRNITGQVSGHEIRVIPYKDPAWKGKSRLARARLIREYDVLHFFKGQVKIFDLLLYRTLARVKIINQFMGTDLYNTMHRSARKRFELKLCSRVSRFIVVGYVLRDELKEMGVAADVVYILDTHVGKEGYSYPSGLSAIAYLPSKAREFFRYDLLLRLAREFPETAFTWFPYKPEPDEELPGNVTALEHIPKDAVLDTMEKHRVFLRLPVHDGGAPLSLVEALSIGRWAVWSYAMTGAERAAGYDDLVRHFRTLVERDTPNTGGETFVKEEFAMDKIIGGFKNLYDSAGMDT